jgi:hypothetical protein
MTDKDADWHFGQFMRYLWDQKQQKKQKIQPVEKFNCNLLSISFSTINVQIGTTLLKFHNFWNIYVYYIKYVLSTFGAGFLWPARSFEPARLLV